MKIILLTTTSTKIIRVDKNSGQPAALTQTNLLATNGVIHIIDRVLMP